MAASNTHGGYRAGAGRKKTEGTRHTWVVPADVEEIVSKHGTGFVWDAVRFKVKFDSIQL